VSRLAVREEYPFPDVDVVPVVSSDSLKDFVARFDVLSSLRIELAPTNNELDNNEFFRLLRESKADVDSKKTVVQHSNPEGLNKGNCVDHVEAAKQGNARVQMKGKDTAGDELVGSNENFSVRASLDTSADSLTARISAAVDKYEDLVAEKVVDVGKPIHDNLDKLKAAHRRFHGGSRL
jgi:hypothetical protein